MTMVNLKYSTFEEVITYLTPEDFQSNTWNFEHASQITTDDTITESADVIKPVNVHVHGMLNFDRSKKKKMILKRCFFSEIT